MNSVSAPPIARPMGLIALMGMGVMLFAAFTASFVIRRTAPDWQPLGFPDMFWASTLILAASSITVELARRQTGHRIWLSLTLVLSFAFIVCQAIAWRALALDGVFLSSHPHASFMYVLTGVHGLHVLGGTAGLSWAAARPQCLSACAAFWHFVGAAWVYVLLLLWVI